MPLPIIAAGVGALGSLLSGIFGNRSRQRQADQARADQARLLSQAEAADRGSWTNRENARTAAVRTRSSLFEQAARNRGYTGAAYDPSLFETRPYGGFDPLAALGGQRISPSETGQSNASSIFGGIANFAPFLAQGGQDSTAGVSPEVLAFLSGALPPESRRSYDPPLQQYDEDVNDPWAERPTDGL